eukprot:TRINITY_DN18105_c0_g1_i1.p1 TRINITY_DN18105_c0_g1~~TRINITY_DN18105_c0_g1_i1.p1  ORF type:complete len:229 (-),score=58.84 TRINITY_DN18105_c0_g1_i1:84-770(-)
MTDIQHKLDRRSRIKRAKAYLTESAYRAAKDASRAVGKMAQEVSAEAEDNAERKAAAATECSLQLTGEKDPAKKSYLAKKCAGLLDAKKQAYAEATNAMRAAETAIKAAGEKEGEVRADASFHQDGTGEATQAENEASAARVRLLNFESERKRDDAYRAQMVIHEKNSREMQSNFERLEQRLKDKQDKQEADEENKAAPPAAPVRRISLPQPDAASRIRMPKADGDDK